MLDFALLGTGGMLPLPNRGLAAGIVRQDGRLLLIDCGEGTQVSLRILGWGFRTIDVICITHFHADHISGLAGLLLSICHSEREEPITLVGPAGLTDVVEHLLVIAAELTFPLRFVEIPPVNEVLHLNISVFDIEVCPAQHRGQCLAYSVSLARGGRFDPERAKLLPIPVRAWGRLQAGEDVEYEGKIYTPDMVLGPKRKGLKIAYITDTRPTRLLADFAANADLLICEGLYGEDALQKKAASRRHMVFSEAARLAKDAGASELWLTHYSPSIANPKEFLPAARAVFPNTKAGFDRKNVSLVFED